MSQAEPQPYELRTTDGGIRVCWGVGVEVRLIARKTIGGRWTVHPPHGVTIKPDIWKDVARRALGRFVETYHPEDKQP